MAFEVVEVFDRVAENSLKYYGLEKTHYSELCQFSENATYMIKNKQTKQKTYVLRISRPGYRTTEELYSEIKWLKEIVRYTPIRVAQPIAGINDDYVQIISLGVDNEYTCMLYEFLEGSAPDESDEANVIKQFVDLGKTTAYLHRQSKMWNESRHLTRCVWSTENMIGPNGYWGDWHSARDLTPAQTATIEKTVAIIEKRLKNYGMSNDKFGLIHADLRLANLLIEHNKIKVIDFDDCGFGWYLHDLASAVSFIETNPIIPKLIESWISGYSEIEALTPEDIAEIDTFIMQRRIQLLAWIESHYNSTPVKELSIGFTAGTVELAKKYIAKFDF